MSDPIRRPAPEGFLWGTAISAHQSEGNNVNSDAWLCETVPSSLYREPSRDACDSYNRYGEDIAIAAELGFNCHRFGIEWARIEPEPGQFSSAELDRYRRVLEACHARGLKPMVTFNHFTVPRWFAARGGFEVADGADLFARFAEVATARLGDLISYASTFNEANIQRLVGQFRRGPKAQMAIDTMLGECARDCGSDRFSSLLFAPVEGTEPVLVDAHLKATAAMKAGPGDFPVGLTLTMQDVQGVEEGHAAEALIQALYGPWLEVGKQADFIGVQTYTRVLWWGRRGLCRRPVTPSAPRRATSSTPRPWGARSASPMSAWVGRSSSPRAASPPTTTPVGSRMWRPPWPRSDAASRTALT